ncbi:MAG: response regulator [Anaerolineae bacterium]
MAQGVKVLIVEDRRENIVFLANNILKPKGFEVITAMDGETGLKKAINENPDLIISDLKLPRMHGLDMLEALRKQGIHTPAIVMTFHGTEQTAIRAFRLGARDYLVKPFKIEDMLSALDRALAIPGDSAGFEKEKAQWQAERAEMLVQLERQARRLQELANRDAANKRTVEMAELAQRSAQWEEECARLNRVIAQQKEVVREAHNRVTAMIKLIQAQRKELERRQNETERLARDLHSMAGAIHMLAQALGEQANHLGTVAPE